MRQQLLDAYGSATPRSHMEIGWQTILCNVVLLTLCALVPIQRQLFCPRGLVFFLFFKISVLECVQPKVVNRLESNDQKNMDLKTSFAINQSCIIGILFLISMSHQFA